LSLVGITALGAAPLCAQTVRTWPSSILLDGFSNSPTRGNFNGLYSFVVQRETFAGGTRYYQRFGIGDTNYNDPAFIQLDHYGGYVDITVMDGRNNGLVITARPNIPLAGTNYPAYVSAGWSGGYTGAAYFNAVVPDEYVQSFPDWAKASTLIPLGFGFAMAFWAAAVALSIGMRWVRDLASVAT